MVKLVKTSMFVVLMLALAGVANATHFENVEGMADCDGWNFSGEVYFANYPAPEYLADVTFTIELIQDGEVVQTATGGFPVIREGEPRTIPFSAEGSWDGDLCGFYTVSAELELVSDTYNEFAYFTVPEFECDCPPEDNGCFRTPGYWKNHDWPVDELMLGGVAMSRDALMEILWSPVGGDATVILAKHTIAAKLNVISGSDSSIQDTIDEADAYLMEHPVFSHPSGDDKHEGLAIKDILVAYNEQGCEDDDVMYLDDDEAQNKAAAVEDHSWSSVKDLYR
jgi:hypothetical protein